MSSSTTASQGVIIMFGSLFYWRKSRDDRQHMRHFKDKAIAEENLKQTMPVADERLVMVTVEGKSGDLKDSARRLFRWSSGRRAECWLIAKIASEFSTESAAMWRFGLRVSTEMSAGYNLEFMSSIAAGGG